MTPLERHRLFIDSLLGKISIDLKVLVRNLLQGEESSNTQHNVCPGNKFFCTHCSSVASGNDKVMTFWEQVG